MAKISFDLTSQIIYNFPSLLPFWLFFYNDSTVKGKKDSKACKWVVNVCVNDGTWQLYYKFGTFSHVADQEGGERKDESMGRTIEKRIEETKTSKESRGMVEKMGEETSTTTAAHKVLALALRPTAQYFKQWNDLQPSSFHSFQHPSVPNIICRKIQCIPFSQKQLTLLRNRNSDGLPSHLSLSS